MKQLEIRHMGLNLETDSAYDGMHAIEVLNKKVLNCKCLRGYLLAIIDLNMPRMGGADLMRYLQDNFSEGKMMEHINTRFILSTA